MHDDREPARDLESPEPLDAREVARLRRRDHDLDAEHRDLMRPGMGKVFKQITDSWSEKRPPARRHAHKATRDDS